MQQHGGGASHLNLCTQSISDPSHSCWLATVYALPIQIWWEWSEYGEDKFVIMFGELHIEMVALKSLETLLEDSGWTCHCWSWGGLILVQPSRSWLHKMSPRPDWPTRLQHAPSTNWWQEHMKTTILSTDWHLPLNNAWLADAWESTFPVPASGAGYGAHHIDTDPLIQERRLNTLPWSILWTDPIPLRKQKREFCLLASFQLTPKIYPLTSNTQKQPGSFTEETLLSTSPEGSTLP